MPYKNKAKQRAAEAENEARYRQTEHGRQKQRERAARYRQTPEAKEKARLRKQKQRELERLTESPESASRPAPKMRPQASTLRGQKSP